MSVVENETDVRIHHLLVGSTILRFKPLCLQENNVVRSNPKHALHSCARLIFLALFCSLSFSRVLGNIYQTEPDPDPPLSLCRYCCYCSVVPLLSNCPYAVNFSCYLDQLIFSSNVQALHRNW